MLKKIAKWLLKKEFTEKEAKISKLTKENLELSDNFIILEKNFDTLTTELTVIKDSILTSEVEKTVHKNDLEEFGEEEIKTQLEDEAYQSLLEDIKPYIKIDKSTEYNFFKINLKLDIYNNG